MKPLTLAILIMAIFFGSCQKELTDFTSSSGGGTGNSNANAGGITGGSEGTILLRAVRTLNNDSVVASFQYDNNNRFISYIAQGKEKFDTFNVVFNIQKYFKRDASGRIISIVSPSTFDTSFFGAADSSRSIVYYPSPTSTEFKALVTRTDAIFATMTDSTVYTYANGRVVSYVNYTSDDFISTVPTINSKGELYYDAAGNLKEIRKYGDNGTSSQLVLISKATYTFDNKPCPHYFKNEGLLVTGVYWGPNNFLTGTEIVNNGAVSQTNQVSNAFNYNSSGYPKNGQGVMTPPHRAFKLTYYYK